jgi:hypothetical protein
MTSYDEQWKGVAEEDRPLYSYNEMKSWGRTTFWHGVLFSIAVYAIIRAIIWFI